MRDFEQNKRRKQEKLGRPFADEIYRDWLGDSIEVERFDKQGDDKFLLDKFFAVDIITTVNNGMILTGQEKFLSYEQSTFNSLTVEYYNNPDEDIKGDWFHLAPQFYFTAYLNGDKSGFCKGIIVNWPNLVIATHRGIVTRNQWRDQRNKHDGALASFRWINFDNIPESCVLYRFDNTIVDPSVTRLPGF